MVSTTKSAVKYKVQDIRPVKVGVVPGARIYSNRRLSAYLQDRVDRAMELYRAGKIEKIIMSGDNRSRYYDEATAMRNYAIENGIPPDDVLRDFAGLRTLDTVWRARDLWQLDEYVIITQQFHLPRSLYLARALGVNVQGFAADNRTYMASVATRLAAREWLARVGAWFDINILRTHPRHLGETQSLSGLAQDAEVRAQQKTIWNREIELNPTPEPSPAPSGKKPAASQKTN